MTIGSPIATCGGYELLEDGPRLLFVQRGTGGYDIALFVFGLLVFIGSGNAVVQIVLAAQGTVPPIVAVIMTAIVALFVVALVLVVCGRRARKARAANELPVILILDRQQGAVCDAGGRAIAPLSGAVVREAFQLGSSSKALEIACGAGVFTIARGSPFSGSIDDIAHALRQRGLRVS